MSLAKSVSHAEERPQEVRDVHRVEVLLLEARVESHVLALGRDGERADGRDAVVPVVEADDRRPPFRPPGAAPRRNEEKAAFVKEYDVGPKSCGFFSRAAKLAGVAQSCRR